MTIEFRKRFDGADTCLVAGSTLLVFRFGAIDFYDLKTLTLEKSVLDFFNVTYAKIAPDEKTFLALNFRFGFASYRMDTGEQIAVLPLNKNPIFQVFGQAFSPDGRSVYILCQEPQEIPPDSELTEEHFKDSVFLTRYSYPDFKEAEKIPVPENFFQITAAPGLGGYLLVNETGNLFVFDGKNNFRKLPIITDKTSFSYCEETNTILAKNKFRSVLYDAKGNEKNHFDIGADQETSVNAQFYDLIVNHTLPDSTRAEPEGTVKTKTVFKEQFLDLEILSSECFLTLTKEVFDTYSIVALYSLKDGKKLGSYKIFNSLGPVVVLKPSHFFVKVVSGPAFLFEVIA
jgi:hypothetical protein